MILSLLNNFSDIWIKCIFKAWNRVLNELSSGNRVKRKWKVLLYY